MRRILSGLVPGCQINAWYSFCRCSSALLCSSRILFRALSVSLSLSPSFSLSLFLCLSASPDFLRSFYFPFLSPPLFTSPVLLSCLFFPSAPSHSFLDSHSTVSNFLSPPSQVDHSHQPLISTPSDMCHIPQNMFDTNPK